MITPCLCGVEASADGPVPGLVPQQLRTPGMIVLGGKERLTNLCEVPPAAAGRPLLVLLDLGAGT